METSTFYGSKHVVSSPKSTVVPTIVWLVNIPGSLAPWKFGQHPPHWREPKVAGFSCWSMVCKHSIMFGIFLQGFDMLKPEFLDHVPSFPIISYGKSKILDDFGMVLWYHHRLGPAGLPAPGGMLCAGTLRCWGPRLPDIKWWIGEGFFYLGVT